MQLVNGCAEQSTGSARHIIYIVIFYSTPKQPTCTNVHFFLFLFKIFIIIIKASGIYFINKN